MSVCKCEIVCLQVQKGVFSSINVSFFYINVSFASVNV